MQEVIFTPTDFVAMLNQTLEVAYPIVVIEGEVSNFKIAKNKWVYFDIKDEFSSLRVFGTTFMMQYPIEDGMFVRLTAQPRLHPQYNFSLNMMHISPHGEGSIKRAADILKTKLEAEGLFDLSRKRNLPYPPEEIALVTSSEAAAYGDFVKVLNARWPLTKINHINVRVQGDEAAAEISSAIHNVNQSKSQSEVIVIIRGGGSADDLLAFQEEILVRTIAESRIPTLVAIGHERDVSLAELAADVRASTPSNAAELLAPDRNDIKQSINLSIAGARQILTTHIKNNFDAIESTKKDIVESIKNSLEDKQLFLKQSKALLNALNPEAVLKRGYSLLSMSNKSVKSIKNLNVGDSARLQLQDGSVGISITSIES